MPDEMLHERGFVALRNAVGADETAFDVRGVDGQDMPFPLAGGKSRPTVLRVSRRVWAAVHPKRSRAFRDLTVHSDCDQLLGVRIAFLPIAVVSDGEIKIGRNIARALIFPQRHLRRVERECIQPAGFIDRNSAIIEEIAGCGGVLTLAKLPDSGNVDAQRMRFVAEEIEVEEILRDAGGGHQRRCQQKDCSPCMFHPGSLNYQG